MSSVNNDPLAQPRGGARANPEDDVSSRSQSQVVPMLPEERTEYVAQPLPSDILFGRMAHQQKSHPGNKVYRDYVSSLAWRYGELALRSQKTDFVKAARQVLRDRRFLKFCEKNLLFKVVNSEREILSKIAHAFRDAVAKLGRRGRRYSGEAFEAKRKAAELRKELKEQEYGRPSAKGTAPQQLLQQQVLLEKQQELLHKHLQQQKAQSQEAHEANHKRNQMMQALLPSQLEQLLMQQVESQGGHNAPNNPKLSEMLSVQGHLQQTNSAKIPSTNNSHQNIPKATVAALLSQLSHLEMQDGKWQFIPMRLAPEILSREVDARWELKLSPLPPFYGISREPICLALQRAVDECNNNNGPAPQNLRY